MTVIRQKLLPVLVVGEIGLSVVLTGLSAHAEPTIIPGITVLTIVKWHGTDCIPARTAAGERDLCNTVTMPRNATIVEHGKALGDLVGVDPVMGKAAWVSCEMYLNGHPYMSDTALAGDGSDVTCLTVLR